MSPLLLILLYAKIIFFGSSVCNGQGAEEIDGVKHGYAWQYNQLLDARHNQLTFQVINTSVNGNSTVKHLAIIDSHLLAEEGQFAVIGLGLGNEGLHEAADKQAVYDQWKTNMQTLIRLAQEAGKTVVVTNNYSRGDYTPADYRFVKRMNIEMHEWDVPTVNLLGALDNCQGDGRWADGYQNGDDIYHPNTAGHTEMMHAFVPSLFDALTAGKPQPVRQKSKGTRLSRNKQLIFTPEDQVHSFTLALHVKNLPNLRINNQSPITNNQSNLPPLRGGAGRGFSIIITHYYAAKKTFVYIDGQLIRTIDGALPLDQLILSGRCTVSDLAFWRSGMNADEVTAWQNGHMLRSSLELYCPLNNANLTNFAQSTNNIQLK